MSLKLTQEQYTEKCKKVHNGMYDYSKTVYINSTTEIIIICKTHGEFNQKAGAHSNGSGCQKCGRKKVKINTQEFIKRSIEVHNYEYDYSKSQYIKSSIPIEIICRKHGSFFQRPNTHLKKIGCSKCGHERGSAKRKYTNEEIIQKSKEVHGDYYDYSKLDYTDTKSKLTIICPKHGEFKQAMTKHVGGAGCIGCQREKSKVSQEEFLIRSKEVHGNTYDYSDSIINGVDKPVKIRCKTHGLFEQEANTHMSGGGCRQCYFDSLCISSAEYIERVKEVHGDLFDYSKTIYTDSREKVTIGCKIHGDFEQFSHSHLQGSGCRFCFYDSKTSKGEADLYKYVNSLYGGRVIKNDRNILNGKELDIYLPELNIAFEYNGLYWHSEAICDEKYHYNKTINCENKGIRLIQIWEDEWKHNKTNIKKFIKNLITEKEVVKLENLSVKKVNCKEIRPFLDKNSLEGNIKCKISYGLYKNNELIQIVCLNKKEDYRYKIESFCTKIGIEVRSNILIEYLTESLMFESIFIDINLEKYDIKLPISLGFNNIKIREHIFYVKGSKRSDNESEGYIKVFTSGISEWAYNKL